MRTETFFGETVGDAETLHGDAWPAPPSDGDLVVTPNRVLSALCDGVTDLVQRLKELTSAKSIVSVRVTEQFGLAIGVRACDGLTLMTVCGPVTVGVGTSDLETSEFKRALGDAARECDEHNFESSHKTPRSKLEAWRRLCAPGSK